MELGSIVSWEKKEGEFVEEGDVLAQVETDKATMEMESPVSGYIAKILVPAGFVEEGDVLAQVETDKATMEMESPVSGYIAKILVPTRDIPLGKLLCVVTDSESDVPAFKDLQDVETDPSPTEQVVSPPMDTPTAAPPTAQQPPVIPQSQPTSVSGGRVFASPYARTVAAERGVDLTTLQGTGYSGLVTSRDVLKATPTSPSSTTPAPPGGFTDIPLTGMRKTIALRLVQSKQTIPHYYLTVDIKMDDILRIRKELNSQTKEFKLSVNDFIVKASALSLREVPEVNSSWMETAIRRHHSVDISVAVSTEGGLITPIIFNADQKGLVQISNDTKELAEKARSGRLRPEEFQGGTFTISNLGMYGVKNFSAVINPPQACILAVGGAERRPVANDNSEQGFSMSDVMSVTLSCDHRVVDGAVGAEWLATLKKTLERPYSMLL
jgi:pyruvate dehydrogenase E2 component (dihydrolipoamide acetyltransferase)